MTMRMIALFLAVAVAGCAPADGGDPRTQLERSIGIAEENAGRYSLQELALIKGIMENPDLTKRERDLRLQAIDAGWSPILSTSF